MCKLNPKIDLVFKKIFGSEQNKNVLKSLINSILPADENIVEVIIKNPYNETDFIGDKLSVVDIKATDEIGRWYDIEIQVKEQKYYGKRAIFYLSEIYSNQLSESDNYDKLKKTIIISLLDFNYFLSDKRYFRRCCYKDFDTGEFYPELDFADLYFVELRKFDNEYKNIKTTLDRWITFFNRASEIDKDNIPEELRDPDIIQAIKTIDTMGLSTREREYYESRKKAMRDRESELQTAIEKAKTLGLQEGLQEGLREGLREGIEKKAKDTAIKLIKKGTSIEEISEITDLPISEIEKIRNELVNNNK